MTLWNRQEQGFEPLMFPMLERVERSLTKYKLYSKDADPVIVEADTAVKAVASSDAEIIKVEHMHCRLPTLIDSESLQLVQTKTKNTTEEPPQETETSAETQPNQPEAEQQPPSKDAEQENEQTGEAE